MNGNKIVAYISGVFALIISGYCYLCYLYMLGFPDGHLTELERAEKSLFTSFIIFNIILSGGFFYLGRPRSPINSSKKVYFILLLYIMVTITVFSIDYYFRQHLEHGGGG